MTASHAWAGDGVPWTHGAWSLERRADELADIRYEGVVVLRSVRAVARDRDWSTAAMRVDGVTAHGDGFDIAVHTEGCGSSLSGAVTVRADGRRLEIGWRGRAESEWLTNRTGLVVLHPPHLAGTALDVVHADGGREATAFPRAISPHQPVVDIAALGWVDAGMRVEVAFAGDVFEMEDQRNWTDASYKTYSRPLALPFPYRVGAGEELAQSIAVTVAGAPSPAPRRGAHVTLVDAGVFPEILAGASTAPDPAPAIPRDRTVLVELDLAAPSWRAALARETGRPLDVRIVLAQDDADVLTASSAAALDAAVDALVGCDVRRIAAFSRAVHTSRPAHVDALRAALVRTGSTAQVLAGARSHFTQLNREQAELPRAADGVAFASTPLFHAVGTEQLVESVAMQRLTAEQAVRIADGLPVHVGPVTLRPRFNDVATAPQPAPSRGDLREGYGAAFTGADDPRQSAPELAAWLVASAAAFAVPGIASVCFFEEWGPRGLRSADGSPYPVLAAFDAVAALAGAALASGASADGLVWAVGGGAVVLAANLDDRARDVEVDTPSGRLSGSLPAFGWARLR
ncbi:hypothetical protein [Microbacterium gilvum]|uniref:Uncharacterized protein n=1 Tax=Microbacterium gilvum TaxID=1336204 RepID=A0ABP8ZY82_9MICO